MPAPRQGGAAASADDDGAGAGGAAAATKARKRKRCGTAAASGAAEAAAAAGDDEQPGGAPALGDAPAAASADGSDDCDVNGDGDGGSGGGARGEGDGGASEPLSKRPRHEVVFAATLKPVRNSAVATDHRQTKSNALAACREARTGMQLQLFPDWHAAGYLQQAIAAIEAGAKNEAAHLQSGFVCYTEEDHPAALKQFEKKLRAFLREHTVGGKVNWQIRELHVHSDWRFLKGYCYKDHLKLNMPGCIFQYASLGIHVTVLRECYKYYLTTAFSNNEGGDSTRKMGVPGQTVDMLPTTRSSLLPEVEVFHSIA